MLISLETSVPYRGLGSTPFATPGGSATLGQQTFIYGRNGSGKTTFSELLREVELGKLGGRAVNASVLQDGNPRRVRLDPQRMPFELRVYNRFYVSSALSGFLSGNDSASGVVQIGKGSVAAESRIQLLQAIIAQLDSRVTLSGAELKDSVATSEQIVREVQSLVIEELAPADPGKYNSRSFTARDVKRLLEESDSSLDGEEGIEDLKSLVARSGVVATIAIAGPTRGEDINPTAIREKVLERVPRQNLVEALAADKALEKWVREGVSLHSPSTTCKFCLDGDVTAQTLDMYAGHFSRELDEVTSAAVEAKAQLEKYLAELNRAEESVLALDGANLLVGSGEVRAAIAEFRISKKSVSEQVEAGIRALNIKLDDPRSRPEWDVAASNLEVGSGRINALIGESNRKAAAFDERKLSALRQLESSLARGSRVAWRESSERTARLTKLLACFEDRKDGLRLKISGIQAELENTSAMAEGLDRDLKYVFGHRSISISTSSDGKRYVVTRDGAPATFLSEGEQNSIAYAYFLRSLEGAGVDPARTVVVIDDPVSSLDKDAMFAGYALTIERLAGFLQLIVLTYDFDYFRLLIRTPTPTRKLFLDAPLGSKEEVKDQTFPRQAALEMVHSSETHDAGLRTLPLKLGDHLSEYHYLFSLIARALLGDGNDEALLLYVNAGRRLLEGFIAFRAPEKTSFQARIDYVRKSNSNVIPDSMAVRMVKFLHSGSHRTDPSPDSSLDFVNTQDELGCMIDFIAMADPAHFSSMCKAVKVDEEALISAIADGRR